jgi:predicted transcriptional regulator
MKQASQHWLQALGLEFWLPLPLLALIFWLSCNLISAQVLNRPYETKDKLQADTQLEVNVSVNVSLIKAVIDRTEGMTQVEVQTTESILRKLEFAFPVTDTNQVETTIAQELGLTRQDVRKLVRYEILD